MSSLANALKRKTHKERAQPAARKKYGLLEKHKDYVLRAKDFHKKEKTIKALRRKAEERNPDEFYFAMEKAKTKGGVHDGREELSNKYSQEELALMKSQDVKYLSLKERVEAEKIRRIKESLHFIGLEPRNKHTVFVDEAAEARAFRPEDYFHTPAELLGRSFNRPRKEQLEAEGAVLGATSGKRLDKAERLKVAAYKEVVQRAERRSKVGALASQLAYEKEVA
eukprot:CAMPEP_0202903222 /NCGR_PEP_ID=MMETSP1392-20130828/22797_1 /ASSEMBLY_ACC=CAM_ASM_000868 /TAXON_ID=225041 /ORGANISM="Chlamydomonas chlamydogama, Strain SAG 11-48b" /LENGTH=223 /DNA_ID=CAMNT_0049590279 /DNA_START=81 /DNA_END=749 /DNA_ORIENTATION=-